jgi:hypothetical protein
MEDPVFVRKEGGERSGFEGIDLDEQDFFHRREGILVGGPGPGNRI